MKSVLLALLLIGTAMVSAGAGYWFGFGRGAQTFGEMATQNDVFDTLGRTRIALSRLQQGDRAPTANPHRDDLLGALDWLGRMSSHVPSWTRCDPRQAATLADAAAYLRTRPLPPGDTRAGDVASGLRLCEGRTGH